MIRNSVFLKAIAFFLILETFCSTVVPTLSWALTSGPTAPEATSFEPVDTTDMVNSITGDFTYNMPLMEVPGPGGSYPITLSYHAQIQPDVDASWVGLGWSLNPGSINRMVNGLPDDFKDINSVRRDFWEGGLMTQESYGISVGIGNVATVSAGLIFANDTYKGRGVGGYIGAGIGFEVGAAEASVNAQVALSPYGDVSASVGVGIGLSKTVGAVKVSSGIGMSINTSGNISSGLSTGISVSKDGHKQRIGGSLMGASIESDGSIGNASVAGFSSVANNSNFGKISSRTSGWSYDIPVYYGINVNLSKQYTRYWMDQKENLLNYGSLNFPTTDIGDMSKKVYDSYHIEGAESMGTGKNAARSPSGTFADYDQYSVNAQGIGGNIRPYHYLLSVYSQDILVTEGDNKVADVLGYHVPQHSTSVKYGFVGDFSGRVVHETEGIQFNQTLASYQHPANPTPDYNEWKTRMQSTYDSTENIPLLFPYSSPTVGFEGHDGSPGTKRTLKKVPGSNHIEYFTNRNIMDNAAEARLRGFIDCNVKGFERNIPNLSDPDGGVGGFAITNSSGVTYNFSLPVYSSEEYTYSQNKDIKDKISFNNVEQKGKYAYTWYLTSVTGPDYVDRGPDGNPDHKLNEYDWGYWVEFQYGKWTDKFAWRNPAVGFNEDLDSRFQSFSKGKKELYYLNAIKTATHTALFVKEIRADGKGVTALKDESVITDNQNRSVTYVDNGGFDFQKDGKELNFIGAPPHPPLTLESDYQKVSFPTATLGLKKIILVENNGNENLALEMRSTKYNHSFTYDIIDPAIVEAHRQYVASNILRMPPSTQWLEHNFPGQRIISSLFKLHLGENVIDIHDLEEYAIATGKILRQIDFDTDYSLTPGTLNSFDEQGQLYDCPSCENYIPDNSFNVSKLGKLTLNAVTFKGKNGLESLPAIRFNYEDTDALPTEGRVITANASTKIIEMQLQNNAVVQPGDIVKLKQGTNEFYGYITENTSDVKIKILTEALPQNGYVNQIKKTKNPPYDKERYDMWGLYKVDYADYSDRNIGRYPNELSARQTDVWSMREIETSLGSKIKINYESDTYSKSILSRNLSVPLSLVEISTDSSYTFPPAYQQGYKKVILQSGLAPTAPVDFISWGYSVGQSISMAAAFYVYDRSGFPSQPLLGRPDVQPTAEIIEVSEKNVKMVVYVRAYAIEGFYGGNLYLWRKGIQHGGGIRVKSIGIDNPFKKQTRYTNYDYEFNNVSSGVTSYEPLNVGKITLNSPYEGLNLIFAMQAISPFSTMLSLAREVPAPGVFYGKLKIYETLVDQAGVTSTVPGYSVFEFETFNDGMVGLRYEGGGGLESNGTHRGKDYHNLYARRVYLKNYTQRLGSLKSITLYDDKGNKVNETINHYLHDQQSGYTFDHNRTQYKNLLEQYQEQGLVEETFNSARWVRNTFDFPGILTEHNLLAVVSKKETYPVIQTGTTTINYKTGIKTNINYLEYDRYSGKSITTSSIDGYGNRFVSEVLPAYKQYPGMGLQIDGGTNMLTQEAAGASFKVDETNTKTGLVSASVQTWSNSIPLLAKSDEGPITSTGQYNLWRKGASFIWRGDDQTLNSDGLYPASSYTPYFSNPNSDQWQKNAQIKLYDIFSHGLEASDVNDNYAATKMSYDQTKVFATAANSQYDEFAFSGAEEIPNTIGIYGGNVRKGNGIEVSKLSEGDNLTTHTGRTALRLTSSGNKVFQYAFTPKPNRDYHASVWVNSNSGRLLYSIDGITQTKMGVPTESMKAGSWYLISLEIPPVSTGSSIEVWCSVDNNTASNFDDFRLCPSDAAMTSYVYNEWGELSHVLNNNNLFTEYRYDGLGRLKYTFQERFNKIEVPALNAGLYKTGEVIYHYANEIDPNAP